MYLHIILLKNKENVQTVQTKRDITSIYNRLHLPAPQPALSGCGVAHATLFC